MQHHSDNIAFRRCHGSFQSDNSTIYFLPKVWRVINRLFLLYTSLTSDTNDGCEDAGQIHSQSILPAHAQLNCFHFAFIPGITYMMLHTGPSQFFLVCNIEKLGVDWGQGYQPQLVTRAYRLKIEEGI